MGKQIKKLRAKGKIPAVLYGHNLSTQSIEIDEREFAKAFKQAGESTLISLMVDEQTMPVLIHDVQNHYLKGNPIHVDFYAVNMTEELKAKIPLHFVGESGAVKTAGGVLVKNLSEVEVICLPVDLPSHFEVDVSSLKTFDNVIRVSDLRVSDKVKILANPEEMVANVAAPRSEEELKALDETVTEDVTAVEGVIKPEKEVTDQMPAEAEIKQE